jgi:hypothetical protein
MSVAAVRFFYTVTAEEGLAEQRRSSSETRIWRASDGRAADAVGGK